MSAINKMSVRSLVRKAPLAVHRPDNRWPLPSAFIGLEIEVEQARIHDMDALLTGGWAQHEDGSLRNQGREFTFAQPLCGKAITSALDVFFRAEPPVVSYQTNPRAAIHIHINLLDDETDDIRTLRNIIAIMYCIEPAVFEWVDAGRKWCGYCSQLNELADKKLRTLMTSESPDVMAQVLTTDGRDRYFGLNVAALGKFGTLEFRYFPCTDDRQKVEDWISFVMLVKRAASEFDGDATALTTALSTNEGIRDFFERRFNHQNLGNRLLECLDMDAAVNRMVDFGYLINLTPARNQAKGAWVTSVAAARFLGKRFPEAAKKREKIDAFVQAYRPFVEDAAGLDYQALLDLIREQQQEVR